MSADLEKEEFTRERAEEKNPHPRGSSTNGLPPYIWGVEKQKTGSKQNSQNHSNNFETVLVFSIDYPTVPNLYICIIIL